MAVTVSDKPWSDWTKADYSPEQWHAACLIHLHEGAPTSKNECKLPVRTPTGTLNRNGVHAAAAALAGARGGVDAPPDKKAAAARALRGYYKQLDEEPPESLSHAEIDEVFAHFGVRGMKWGVRNDSSGGAGHITKTPSVTKRDMQLLTRVLVAPKKGRAELRTQREAVKGSRASAKASKAEAKVSDSKADAKILRADKRWANKVNTNRYMAKNIGPAYKRAAQKVNSTDIPRINNQAKYKNADLRRNSPLRQQYYKEHQDALIKALNNDLDTNVPKSPSGRKQVTLSVPKSQYLNTPIPSWAITVKDVAHAVVNLPKLRAIFDDMGLIERFVVDEDEMAQDDSISNFFAHFGIKGMKWGVRRSDAQLGKDKPDVSEDKARALAVSAKIGKKRDTSSLSNKEMQDLITRMNLEQQYSRLSGQSSTKAKINKGYNGVKKTIEVANTVNQAVNFVNSPTGKFLTNALSKPK